MGGMEENHITLSECCKCCQLQNCQPIRLLPVQSCEGIFNHKHIATCSAEREKLEINSELKFAIRRCQQIVNNDQHLFLLNRKNIHFLLQIFENVGKFKPKIANTHNLETSFLRQDGNADQQCHASGFQLNDICDAIEVFMKSIMI